MTIASTGNNSLDQITASYQSNDTQKAEKEDQLGRDTFLTMLVAQLQNQDPLNPMDGTDFSAQLAQFSQLEQLISLNDSMEEMAKAFSSRQENDVVSLVGKQVTGNVDVMQVEDGTVTGGFYDLPAPADIMITVTDEDGKTVKTLFEGQQNSGAHIISWDGTDNNGKAVEDGSYKYTVMANSGYGFVEMPASVTGTVDGITYNNGKPYLVVQGVLLDPESLTAVSGSQAEQQSSGTNSSLEYLGKTVSTNSPVVLVDDGAVQGSDLTFDLEVPENVTVNIYDAFNELVRTISIPAEDVSGGNNSVSWDGVSNGGYQVADGLYYYTVKTPSGGAQTPMSEEVSGIKYINNTKYLVMKDSGRLVALSAITGIDS